MSPRANRCPATLSRSHVLRGSIAGFCRAWLLLSAAFASQCANAEAPTADGFEGAETSWRFAEADTRYQVETHQRTSEGAHGGAGCEVARIRATGGTFVHLGLDIAPAYVIAELQPSLWVRANRPGIQLFARVVFPRTADPHTGKPLSRLVGGSRYTQQG